jgi:DNA-binding YbaB/EbfC family protein
MDINQNLGNLMKEAQKMQQRMQEAQEQLIKLLVDGESGAGLVKVQLNGRHETKKVTISKTLMEEDVEMLQDLLMAAWNDAVRKLEKISKEKISQLTAGLNIPTDFMKDGEKE